ncbi:MAG TPA: glycosyltransferase [Candidatus Binatia bacterium]|nr:glycosyltransferase [Candidatus Binatia bacterium]
MILSVLLGALAVLSLGVTLWQIVVAARFPLHRREAAPQFAPAITLLKPLKGCDAETAECLRSWLTQHYAGPLQVLFGAASAEDPVCDLVRRLIAEHPDAPAQLVICPEQLGPNAKVSQLIQLERLALHEVLCLSDADVWAPPDFLANAVGPLRDGMVGLVNSFYRLANSSRFAMRWEAFAVNADFWSQVLQSLSLKPMDFALGAAILTLRRPLAAIGGFAGLVEHLADDYQLGNRIAGTGAGVVLCPVVVECRSQPTTFAKVWSHQLRWARTIRVCQPGPYFWSVLGNASLWPLIWLATCPSTLTLVGVCLCLSVRMFAGQYLERRLTGRSGVASCAMALVKDVFQVALWALAFTGRQVAWRGVNYQIEAGGKLVKLADGAPAPAASA